MNKFDNTFECHGWMPELEMANHDCCWTASEKSSDRRGNEVKGQVIIKK